MLVRPPRGGIRVWGRNTGTALGQEYGDSSELTSGQEYGDRSAFPPRPCVAPGTRTPDSQPPPHAQHRPTPVAERSAAPDLPPSLQYCKSQMIVAFSPLNPP